MPGRVSRSLLTGALSGAVLAVCAACGAPGPAAPSAPGSPSASGSPSAPAAPVAASPGSPAAAGCDTSPWATAPLAAAGHAAVPPVPVVRAVRTAAHPDCGYDRLVVDVSGALPGYSVRYVSAVVADPSGATISLPGQRYLLIALRTAQAHTDAGALTLSRQVHVVGYPALTSWVLAGDFEGVVRLGVGLSGTRPVRVSELPGRIVIDVRH